MNRCPSCDYPLPHDRERLGARCTNCREPLYEPATRVSRPARPDEGACAVHAGRETVGTCGRCGNYFCEICRTRWRERILCVACVQRALESREAAPEQDRAQRRQAWLGLLCGATAWIIVVLGFILAVATAAATGPSGVFAVGLLLIVSFLASILLSIAGVGQAAAALRARGRHLILATAGLIVSGLQIGTFIGWFVVALWTS